MDYKRKVLEYLPWYIANENIGIYPQSTIEKGKKKKRTKWQDGWNACAIHISEEVEKIDDFIKNLPDEIIDYIINDKVCVALGTMYKSEPHLLINCNDLFYWGCADAQEITIDDISDFNKAIKETERHGEILWCCRKRNMRPQKPYYKYFNEKETKLFDDCGPERDE